VAQEIETAILDHALEHPCHGSTRVEQELRLKGIQVSSGGVRGVWQRHNLLTKHEWPAAGSVDTEIRCLMELEGSHAEKDIQPRVQA